MSKRKDPAELSPVLDILRNAVELLIKLHRSNPDHQVFEVLKRETTRPSEKHDRLVLHAIQKRDVGELVSYLDTCTTLSSIFCALGLTPEALLEYFRFVPLDGDLNTELAEPNAAGKMEQWLKEKNRSNFTPTSGRNNSCAPNAVALGLGHCGASCQEMPPALRKLCLTAAQNASANGIKVYEYVGSAFRSMLSQFVTAFPNHPTVKALSGQQRAAIDAKEYLDTEHLRVLAEILGIPILICPQASKNRQKYTDPRALAHYTTEIIVPTCMTDLQFLKATAVENVNHQVLVVRQVVLSNGALHFEACHLHITKPRDLACFSAALRDINIKWKSLRLFASVQLQDERGHAEDVTRDHLQVSNGAGKISVDGNNVELRSCQYSCHRRGGITVELAMDLVKRLEHANSEATPMRTLASVFALQPGEWKCCEATQKAENTNCIICGKARAAGGTAPSSSDLDPSPPKTPKRGNGGKPPDVAKIWLKGTGKAAGGAERKAAGGAERKAAGGAAWVVKSLRWAQSALSSPQSLKPKTADDKLHDKMVEQFGEENAAFAQKAARALHIIANECTDETKHLWVEAVCKCVEMFAAKMSDLDVLEAMQSDEHFRPIMKR